MELMGIINVEFSLTNQILSFTRYWKNSDHNEAEHQLIMAFQKAYV
jgi:hypothetical protein